MGVSNAWAWTSRQTGTISSVYVTGSMNSWNTNAQDWKLSSIDGNHWKGTFYLKGQTSNYTFKLYINAKNRNDYYSTGYNYHKDWTGGEAPIYTDKDNASITPRTTTTTKYIKVEIDFYASYGSDDHGYLSVTQTDVSDLSPSLNATSTALIAGGTSTLTASCSGGSGGYTYSYKVTCDGIDVTNSTLTTSGSSVKFTAPTVTENKKYTITVTAKDSHALLSELATKTATQTITVYESQYILRGSTVADDNNTGGMAGWSANNNNAYTVTTEGSKMTIIANLTNAKTQYKFKIYNCIDGEFYGQVGSSEIPNNTSWTLDGSNDVKFTTTAAGPYTFIYNTSNKSIIVQYPTEYTVTYSHTPAAAANAPTTSPSVQSGNSVVSGTSLTFTAQAAKKGYTFAGWYDNNAGTGNALSSNLAYTRSITANTTIYAVYTANTYTVKFDANGHGAAPTEQKISEGGKVTAPTEPTAEGYIFGGWYKEPACINKWNFDTDIVNNDITLYAQWECALTKIEIEGTYAITQGGTISLRVADNPNITPQTTYLWKRGNEEVGNERILTVSCELKNAGNYTCTVTNDHCSATNNFTVKYYHLKGFVEGDDNQDPDAWDTPREFVWDGEGDKATLSIELKGHTTYQFKLNDGTSWYWNEGTITYNNRTNWEIEQQGYDTSDKQNTKITTTAPGIYTFTLNYDNAAKPQLSVIYPEEQIVYLKPGVWDVDGAKFTIYSWSSLEYTPSKFTQMELADCNGNVYKANIDPAHDWVSFIRAEHYVEKWEADIWDRSLDLKILNDPQFEILKLADLDETFGNNKKKSSGKWSAYIPYYNISYNMNGHGTQISDACIQGGNSWSAPTDPTEVGYTFQGWRRPVATGDDNLYKSGSSGYTPTASETLTAQWDAIPKYTVSFSTGTDNPTQASITETKGGAGITLPTGPQPICTDWIFAGWWTEEVSSTNTSPGTLLKAGDNYNPTSNITLYAVYSTEEVGDAFTKYAKVTENLDDWSGKYLLSTGTYTATGEYDSNGTQGHLSRREYTPGNEEKVEWEFTLTKIGTTGYSILFPDGSWYLGCHTDTYFRRSVDNPANSSAYLWTPTIEGITNVNESSRKIADNGSTDFRPYSTYPLTAVVYLYKRVGGGSTTIYNSNPTCLVPVWNGADIDKTDFTVNCGERSPMEGANGAAKITFSKDKIYNFSSDITITASEGFLVSTSRTPNGNYKQSVFLSPLVGTDYPNTFNDKYVYVRAEAPTKSDSDLEGEITIKDSKGNTLQTIAVFADVSCTQYTLTFNDQGQTKTVEGFAGTTVEAPEPWAGLCTEPIHYVFDGWAETPVANDTEEYEKIDVSTYTMPGQNKTLYAVYRYAEDGSEPVNAFVKVTEALTDWTGDYVIVNETAKKAIGNEYAYTNTLTAVDVEITDNHQVKSPTNNIIWQIRKSGENYTMFNESAGKYAYITGSDSQNAGLSDAVQYINISWGSSPTTVRVIGSGDLSERCFSYYAKEVEWRTYSTTNNSTGTLYKRSNKSLLYTSSLICGEISVEDDNVVVTSTKDQKVKVNVPIKVSSYYNDVVNVTGVGESTFSVSSLNDVTVNTDETINLELTYSPSEYDHLDNETITLTASNGATTTFQVKGRSLPDNFVIAAKAGNEWVALTAKVSNGTQVAVPIIVDNKATPTKASVALNTTQYQLLGLKTNNRYTANGTAVHLYSTQTQKVLNASTATGTKTYLNTYATHGNAEVSDDALFYEWQLVSKDLVHYTITNSNQTADWEDNRILGYSAATGMWGMYSKGTNINQDLFLLPVETVLTEIDMEVMEWGENSIALRIPTDAPENIQVTLGENTSEAKDLTNLNADGSASDLYKVGGLTLNSNDCEVMMITDADNTTRGTLIRKPIIITGEVESTTYTSDDCPHCDVVVLKDAKLKAGSSHLDFANIYVYPGGKLVLDEKSLGVKQQVYLRGGYSWLNQSTYALPEVYLNGDINFNGSNNIIYDYYIQNYKYYQFALPYDVQLAKVTDEAGIDNFPVWVKHYNGALRAADPYATSWEWYPSENGDADAYFKAGEGYIIAAQPRQVGNTANRPLSIIRFPLGNKVFNKTNGLESDLSITTKAHGIDGYKAGTVTANNVGWNFVGNPFLSTWKGDIGYKQLTKHPNEANWDGTYDWVDANIKYITIMSAESGSDYAQYIASNTELKPFFPFFMQETAEGGTGSINFTAANRIKKAPAELYADEPREAFVQIEILTDVIEDQTGIFVSDTYSDDIDFDDYEKMFGSSADKSKLWLVHDNKRMAFEAMTETSAAANIALGYRAPKTGSYTFAINEDVSALNEVMGVYLTDHELGVTDYNLLYNAYEFETEAANYNDKRFTIRIVLRDNSDGVGTGIDNLGTMNAGIYKFIYQDKMYIYNGGVIYDATGKQVITINK